jgi:hypothetical protein
MVLTWVIVYSREFSLFGLRLRSQYCAGESINRTWRVQLVYFAVFVLEVHSWEVLA